MTPAHRHTRAALALALSLSLGPAPAHASHLSPGTAQSPAAAPTAPPPPSSHLSPGTSSPTAAPPPPSSHLSPGTSSPPAAPPTAPPATASSPSPGTAPPPAAAPTATPRSGTASAPAASPIVPPATASPLVPPPPSPATATPLSPGTAPPAAPAPSERDLAYDLGIQAEASGDHARSAAAFERAYRLTTPAETGPRLLFLRASVAARLRADDGTPTTRVQLCHAQALLRDYLRDTRDPAAEEHLNLGRVEQRLAIAAGPDCATLLGPVDPPAPEIQPPVAATTPAPRTNPPAQPPPSGRRTPGQRALLASGVVGLGVAVAGFSVMSAGIVTSRDAYRLGQSSCHEGANACSANDSTLYDIRDRGELGNRLTRIGAVVGGLAVLAGVTMIVVGETLRRRPRVALTPHLAPHVLGLGLSGRF